MKNVVFLKLIIYKKIFTKSVIINLILLTSTKVHFMLIYYMLKSICANFFFCNFIFYQL